MELLDQFQLPRERTLDYLVGIWVLTKGKLVAPPQPPAPALEVPTASVSPPPPLPKFDLASLQQLSLLQPIPPLSQPSTSSHPTEAPPLANLQAPASLGLSPPHVASTPPQPHLANPNLAAEVASLTPEQIQLMLQTLTKTGVAPAVGQAPALHQQPHIPPPAAMPGQPWPPHNQYAAPFPGPPQPPHNNNSPPYPDNREYDYGYGPNQPPYAAGPGYDRDRPYPNAGGGYRARGGRGRGGDRGRNGQGWQKNGQRGRGGPPPTGPRNRNASGPGGAGWGGEAHQQRQW